MKYANIFKLEWIYLKYVFDSHRPMRFISSSDKPSMAKVVALPILNEWEVRRELRNPKVDNELMSNAEN